MPKGRGKKYAKSCMRSDQGRKAVKGKMSFFSKTLSGRARLVWNDSFERRQQYGGSANSGFGMGLLHGRLQK